MSGHGNMKGTGGAWGHREWHKREHRGYDGDI